MRERHLIKVEGVNETLKSLDKFGRKAGVHTKISLVQVAAIVCERLAAFTQPYGLSSKAKKTGEGAVVSDIDKVIAGAATGTVERWNRGNRRLKDGTELDFNLGTGGVEEAREHHRRSRRARGRVYRRKAGGSYEPGVKWTESRLVVSIDDKSELIEEVTARVGLAKSVWANARESLTRFKGVSAGRIPRWISRHKGAGESRVRVTLNGVVVYLVDKLGYLDDSQVLAPGRIDAAIRDAFRRKVKQLEKILEAEGKKP